MSLQVSCLVIYKYIQYMSKLRCPFSKQKQNKNKTKQNRTQSQQNHNKNIVKEQNKTNQNT